MDSKIVIGDCHGCYKTLLALIEKLPHRNVCFSGDLIDRGPMSSQVVQYVIDNQNIMWHRNKVFDREELFQVIGHTPVPVIEETHYYANIDTGCVYNRFNGAGERVYGLLTALQFPEMIIYQQENID